MSDTSGVERDNNGVWEYELAWEDEPCALPSSDRAFAIERTRRQSVQSVLQNTESNHTSGSGTDVVRMKDLPSSPTLGNRMNRSEIETNRGKRRRSARSRLRVTRRLKDGMIKLWKKVRKFRKDDL